MPRNMSFMLTKEQVYNQTKTVTRRLGWHFLKSGDEIWACEKCQGLTKGEKITKISPLKIISTSLIHLWNIVKIDCKKEGFPDLSPNQFVEMFCKEMKCNPDTLVNRIEFEYIDAFTAFPDEPGIAVPLSPSEFNTTK